MHFTGIKFCAGQMVNYIHADLFANPQKYQTLVPTNNSHLKV